MKNASRFCIFEHSCHTTPDIPMNSLSTQAPPVSLARPIDPGLVAFTLLHHGNGKSCFVALSKLIANHHSPDSAQRGAVIDMVKFAHIHSKDPNWYQLGIRALTELARDGALSESTRKQVANPINYALMDACFDGAHQTQLVESANFTKLEGAAKLYEFGEKTEISPHSSVENSELSGPIFSPNSSPHNQPISTPTQNRKMPSCSAGCSDVDKASSEPQRRSKPVRGTEIPNKTIHKSAKATSRPFTADDVFRAREAILIAERLGRAFNATCVIRIIDLPCYKQETRGDNNNLIASMRQKARARGRAKIIRAINDAVRNKGLSSILRLNIGENDIGGGTGFHDNLLLHLPSKDHVRVVRCVLLKLFKVSEAKYAAIKKAKQIPDLRETDSEFADLPIHLPFTLKGLHGVDLVANPDEPLNIPRNVEGFAAYALKGAKDSIEVNVSHRLMKGMLINEKPYTTTLGALRAEYAEMDSHPIFPYQEQTSSVRERIGMSKEITDELKQEPVEPEDAGWMFGPERARRYDARNTKPVIITHMI